MDNHRDLQARARALEAGGQHAAALELYRQALPAISEHGGALWAHAGDLELRLGNEGAAAELYSTAVERFAAAECLNVALALCQRILRVDPSRTSFLLRFGELSASLGYHRDARHGYLEFAAVAESKGDVDGAADALRAYLREFPHDGAVRARLEELTGEGEEELPATVEEPEPLGLLSTGFETDDDARPAPGSIDVLEESLIPTAEPADVTAPEEVAPLEGFETTAADEEWSGERDEVEILPLLSTEVEESPADFAGEATPEIDPLPLMNTVEEADEPQEEVSAEPLPFLVPTADPVEALRERVARDPADREGHRELVDFLEEQGDHSGLATALEAGHEALATAGDFSAAAGLLRRLVELRPSDLALHLRWVEYAERAQSREGVVAALLALARRYEAGLDTERARATFMRVLDLDPASAQAASGLAALSPAARPPRDYVDLAALVLSDEPEDRTRFQVSVGEPTGDEAGDLAEILGLFREKVAQSLDPKDVASQYDLGLAFKEMGLLDDAIVQFQSALRAGSQPLPTLEMLGECFVGKGEYGMASRLLDRATRIAGVTDSDLVGVHYWLARSHEALEQVQEARTHYERVVAVDLGFRDAAVRLEGLRAR